MCWFVLRWWLLLHPYLDSQLARQIAQLEKQLLSQRKHAVSSMLHEEVARIERELWAIALTRVAAGYARDAAS